MPKIHAGREEIVGWVLRTFKPRFLRQRPIDNYIVDFYCAQLKLVIEIDGDIHFTDEGMEYDERRTRPP